MPMAIAIPLIAAGITAGSSIYSARVGADAQSDAINAQKQDALTAQRTAQQQELSARRQALMKAAPGLQESVGGSLTPESFSSMIAQLTGNPGSVGLAQSTLFPANGLQHNQNEPGLSDAMDHLFQSGGADTASLTMPY